MKEQDLIDIKGHLSIQIISIYSQLLQRILSLR